MLLTLALIFSIGLLMGEILSKIKIPRFIGMIITGIILGPYVLNLIDSSILDISHDLREIALVVILLRAGLSLDLEDLKKIGKPALLMSFIPATIEIIIITILAPIFFSISYIEAAILGSVLAAVSPAVVVPKMIKLMEEGYGSIKKIPQLVMASASVDDIYVIVLFSSFLEMYQTNTVDFSAFIIVPVSIILGVLLGAIIGLFLSKFFQVFRVRDTIKVLIILAASFFILSFESMINNILPVSGLLAIMVLGISFLNYSELRALRLRQKFSKLWVFAELVLFVLVGAAVNIHVAASVGMFALVLIIIEIISRIFSVHLCLIKSELNNKERTFAGIAYTPKATVQAAIGAIPLTVGVASGELILALAVLAIMVTAPLGAISMNLTYKKLLVKSPQEKKSFRS
ncbi:MAG: cation:proton antiporter [Candidatus Izimaplasma sp.]|nr:cation:proton antiporter [Candidatus Izimaplasma bacterium]